MVIAALLSACSSQRAEEGPEPAAKADGQAQPQESGTKPSTADSPEPATGPAAEVQALKREANELAARVLKKYPRDASSHVLKGSVCFYHGDTLKAEKAWRKALDMDPNRADAYNGISSVAWEQGKFEKAVAACREALRLHPTMLDARIRMGQSLMELDRTEEAIKVMEQTVQQSPQSADAHFILAQACMQAKEYAKAKENFLRAVELRPNHIHAYYGLATASARLGQRDEARVYQEKFRTLEAADLATHHARRRGEKTLSNLAEQRTTTANACTVAAGIYRDYGKVQEAEQLLQRAAVIDPENTVCRAQLMVLYRRGNRPDDALAFCEKLTQLQPEIAVNFFHLGNVHLWQRRHDQAEQAYQKIVELIPDQPEGYLALVHLHLETGQKLDEAKAAASKAIELKPIPHHYFLLATVCHKSGDQADALAAIERALEMAPDNVQYQQLKESLQKEK